MKPLKCSRSHHNLSLAILLAGTAFAAGACTSAEDDQAPPTDAPVTTPVPDEPSDGNALGTWAMRRVFSANTQIEIIGVVTNTSVSYSLVTLTGDGATRTAVDHPCAIALESSNPLAKPSLAAAYVEGLPSETIEGAFSEGALTLTPAPNVQGASLANPAADPMPTEPTDATVRDDDGDGNPGITVYLQVTGLGAQQLYVAQRLIASWRATTVGEDLIQGVIDIDNYEQIVLGASNALFDSDAPIVANPTGNTFTLARVDDTFSCADLRAADEAALFGARP